MISQLKSSISLFLAILTITATLAAGAQQEEDLFKIRFKKAEIQDFIDQVAAITGKTFIVSPVVKGSVTVSSDVSLDRKGVYELLLATLRIHGFGTVEENGIVKIVRHPDMRFYVNLSEDGQPSEQLITRVMRPKHIRATELMKVVRNLIPQYASVSALEDTNALIFSHHRESIDDLARLIDQIDVDNDVQIVVVPLKHAWVGNVMHMLREIAPDYIGGATEKLQRITAVANEKTNSIILSGTPIALARVLRILEELDKKSTHKGAVEVFHLSNADAKPITEILTGMFPQSTTDTDPGSPEVYITFDESLNAIVAKSDPATLQEIRQLIDQLDIRKPQVLLEAAIVEIAIDADSSIGVELAVGDNESKSLPALSTSVSGVISSLIRNLSELDEDIDVETILSQATSPSLAIARLDPEHISFGAILQAIASNSSSDLLQTPHILALDNEEAKLHVGQTVPFRQGSVGVTNNAGGTQQVSQISRDDIGITLTVKPQIHEDKSVRMEILQEVEVLSDIPLAIGDSGIADIVTDKRELSTTIVAENKQTIVLGGLIQDDIREVKRRVPGLSRIPLLGGLFQNSTTQRGKIHLLVFIRPTVLSTQADLNAASERKYKEIWHVLIKSRESLADRPDIEAFYEGPRD